MKHSQGSPIDRAHGFTLIELMIVVSILGLLFAVLAPSIFGVQTSAEEGETNAVFLQLKTAANRFKDSEGYYPPADMRVRTGKQPGWKPDNGQNTGIESFVMFVSWKRKGGTDLGGLGDNLVNTDGDANGATLLLLDRVDRPEICDSWGTPLAYFTKYSMEHPQQITGFDGVSQPVKARKDERGKYLGARAFQFLSAGKDGQFNTEDDLTWPRN